MEVAQIFELRRALCGASRFRNENYHARVHAAAQPLRHSRLPFGDDEAFRILLNRLHDQAVDQAHMSPLDNADIDGVGVASTEILEDDCAVCMDHDENAAEEIKTLSCGHKFHKGCVDRWFQEDGSCPMCRNRETSEGF